MDWTSALRHHATRIELDGAQAEIILWAHAPHLSDNVPHRHTYFEVCTVGRWGSGVFTLNGRTHAIAPGDTFFARPGEEHRIQNTSPQLMELFWVSFALAPSHAPKPDSLAQLFARSSTPVRRSDASTLAIWHALEAAAKSEGRGRPDVLQSLARALLVSIFQAGVEANATQEGKDAGHLAVEGFEDEHHLARLAVRYIHDNLSRRLPVSEIAAHVHASPRHLARLFRRFTGTSPADYIEAARIQRARHLLGHERATIKQAASAVGYGDVQHFSRAFARRAGIAPGAFVSQQESVTVRATEEGDMV